MDDIHDWEPEPDLTSEDFSSVISSGTHSVNGGEQSVCGSPVGAGLLPKGIMATTEVCLSSVTELGMKKMKNGASLPRQRD